jgi:hypothetical protein
MNKRQRKKRYRKYTKELSTEFINFIRDDSLCHKLMSPISVERLEEIRKVYNAYTDYYMRAMLYPTFNLTEDGDKIILSINTGK